MSTAFKVVRGLPVTFSPPGGGVTWDADTYTANDDVIGLTTGNGVAGFTVGKTGTYAVSLGRAETIGSLDGSIWTVLADSTSSTVSLTASTQYYAQGPEDEARSVKLMLGYRLSVRSSSSSDTGSVYLRGLDINGVDVKETLTLSGASLVASSNYYKEILSLTKDETTGTVVVVDAQGFSFRMAPKQTVSRFSRIEFDTAPTSVGDMVVVYKKKVRELKDDGDGAQISGIDQALMTFALGDLYTKQRQLNKASLKYNEATVLLEIAKERESVQQAQHIVLVPDGLGANTVADFGWD